MTFEEDAKKSIATWGGQSPVTKLRVRADFTPGWWQIEAERDGTATLVVSPELAGIAAKLLERPALPPSLGIAHIKAEGATHCPACGAAVADFLRVPCR